MTQKLNEWLENRFKNASGKAVNPGNMKDVKRFAQELGSFVFALQKQKTALGVEPSFANDFIGSDLTLFEAELDALLLKNEKLVPAEFLHHQIDLALKKPWTGDKVWVLGDFFPKNVLVSADGVLSNVVSTDKNALGDPAWNLAIAWLIFDDKARKIFFSAAGADAATIDRARILALRNGLTLYFSEDIDELIQSRDSLTEILKDYHFSGGIDGYDVGGISEPEFI